MADDGSPVATAADLAVSAEPLTASSSESGGHRSRTTYRWVGVAFPRLLAGIYLAALLSWNAQWRGLVGSEGILPLAETVAQAKAIAAQDQRSLFWELPSLFYLNSSDAWVQACLYAGILIALLVMVGFIPGLGLLLLWVIYLSIVMTGGVFTGFQWDSLLLECGFLALLASPWTLRLPSWRRAPDPPRVAIWLLHWLLFRLMFLSGLVKWAGGDACWQSLTALDFHFETQPLPNPWSWHFHHLPESLHRAGCAAMLAIELLLPFALFLGRWGRLTCSLGVMSLMAVILVSGNYTFFNGLAMGLSLCLLDDSLVPWIRCPMELTKGQDLRPTMRRWLAGALFVPVICLTLASADQFLAQRVPGYNRLLPSALHAASETFTPFRTFNAYGLFQAMTRDRPEIIVEVSDDGIFWLPLQFHWKPGAPDRRPGQAAPHQPRLDWQMWFAALSPGHDPERDAHPASPTFWFGRFLAALLRHQQPVWDLIEPPPLPVDQIAFIRARIARYTFTSPEQRQASGHWWHVEPLGLYSPPVQLHRP